MLRQKPGSEVDGVLSKILADFLMVHTCLVLTLVGSWIRGTEAATQAILIAEARDAIDQYLHLFLPLSLVFPTALFLTGSYKDHGEWTLRRRVMTLFQGVALGLTVFVTVSLVLLPDRSLGARSLVFFCFVLFFVLASARLSEWAILSRLRAKRKSAASIAEELPVLVIGGAGYIGSVLVRKLLDSGKRVRVLDSLVYGDGALREVINHPHLELMIGDSRNLQAVSRATSGVQSVVHLAAIVGDPACAQNEQAALEINYAATRMLIEVAKGHAVSRLVFVSSCSVYGASEKLMDETSEVSPISLYAQTKVDSEKALLQACTNDFQPTIVRLATVFGLSPRPRFDLVVNLLTAKASKGDPITIFNGEQWRPFIHVSDVAEGLITMLNAPLAKVGGQVFNLGDNRMNYTLTDVAQQIIAFYPEAPIEHVAVADRRDYKVSFDKIHNSLGFACSLELSDGIQEIKQAFAEGRILDYTSYQYNNQKFLQVAGCPANQDEEDENVMAAFTQPRKLARASAVAAGV